MSQLFDMIRNKSNYITTRSSKFFKSVIFYFGSYYDFY